MPPPAHRLRKFRFNHPQRIAALLLVAFLTQCLWIINHHSLSTEDYRYAQCGREMWERPLPFADIFRHTNTHVATYGVAGYFTSCGNLHDGTLAYRAAGLPLTIATHMLAGPDTPASASMWELRHEISAVSFLVLLPFTAAGLALGACLWWVARRLFGNRGGYLTLALYCFSPPVLDAATHPNNDILAALGLFSLVYTAIGVSHAMQGPTHKWRPRILLLTIIFGFTAAAHISAMLIGLLLAAILMAYLAEGRRAYLPSLLLTWLLGAMLLLFASYGFHPEAFSYVFRSSAALLSFSFTDARHFLGDPRNAGLSLATAAALSLWITHRRSRYFGNTVPLAIATVLFLLVTTGVESRPWIWALPFLLVFVGGVFGDAFETCQRRLFFALAYLVAVVQAVLCTSILSALSR
jgi:hypothetical protein